MVCCSQGFSGAQSKKGFGNVEKEDKKGKKIAKELGQKGKVPPKAVAIKEGSREMKKLIDSVEKVAGRPPGATTYPSSVVVLAVIVVFVS